MRCLPCFELLSPSFCVPSAATFSRTPVLCLPMFSDQPDNCARMAERGMGLTHAWADVTRHGVMEGALERLLGGWAPQQRSSMSADREGGRVQQPPSPRANAHNAERAAQSNDATLANVHADERAASSVDATTNTCCSGHSPSTRDELHLDATIADCVPVSNGCDGSPSSSCSHSSSTREHNYLPHVKSSHGCPMHWPCPGANNSSTAAACAPTSTLPTACARSGWLAFHAALHSAWLHNVAAGGLPRAVSIVEAAGMGGFAWHTGAIPLDLHPPTSTWVSWAGARSDPDVMVILCACGLAVMACMWAAARVVWRGWKRCCCWYCCGLTRGGAPARTTIVTNKRLKKDE